MKVITFKYVSKNSVTSVKWINLFSMLIETLRSIYIIIRLIPLCIWYHKEFMKYHRSKRNYDFHQREISLEFFLNKLGIYRHER